jgi:glucan phosphoethanolaminetransferase (alkaline phosphatase superfamily)
MKNFNECDKLNWLIYLCASSLHLRFVCIYQGSLVYLGLQAFLHLQSVLPGVTGVLELFFTRLVFRSQVFLRLRFHRFFFTCFFLISSFSSLDVALYKLFFTCRVTNFLSNWTNFCQTGWTGLAILIWTVTDSGFSSLEGVLILISTAPCRVRSLQSYLQSKSNLYLQDV